MVQHIYKRATYDREAAVRYALAHWNAPNPAFANMDTFGGGGDCTNFTSQCLWAAGWPMDYRGTGHETEWWYRRVGGDAFDASGDDWWSCTWSVPENQFHYLTRNHGRAVDLLGVPFSVRELEVGDLIFYDWDGAGVFGHGAIITGFDRFRRPLVTYRTLYPRPPVRNQTWGLHFRGSARRIVAVKLVNTPEVPAVRPDWSALRPCDTRRLRLNQHL